MDSRGDLRSIYRESLPILLVSLGGGLFAGLVLEGMLDDLAEFPGLLVLVPAFLATRGNVYGALGARLSSGLHQGIVEPEFAWDRRLVAAVTAAFVNAVGVSVLTGVLAWTILELLGRETAHLGAFVGVVLVASLLTSVVLITGLLFVVFTGFKLGYDPDNLVGPIVTTLGDVFGMVFLFVALAIVGVVF